MKTTSTRSVALFIATFVMGTTLPFVAAQSLNGLALGDTLTGPDGVQTTLHAAYTTKDRVDYGRAIDIYNIYLQEGQTGLIKPDINDRATIDLYLNNPGTGKVRGEPLVTEPLSTKDYVPPEKDVSPIDALSQQERAALLRSEKTGVCWQYKGFSAGYMTLCQSFIKDKEVKRTTGLQTDLIYGRTTGRAFLNNGGMMSSKISIPLTVKGYDYNSVSSRAATRRQLRGSATSK